MLLNRQMLTSALLSYLKTCFLHPPPQNPFMLDFCTFSIKVDPLLASGFCITAVMWLWGRVCGKRAGEYNKKADNPLSEVVYEKVGGEDVYYAGTYYEDDVMIYDYTIRKFDEEVIRNFAETVQQVLCTEESKVEVLLERPISNGAWATVSVLLNHSLQAGSEADYIGLRWAQVNCPSVFYPTRY